MGTKHGEVHYLRLPSYHDETTTAKTWDDGSSTAVTGRWKSREIDLGDSDVVKVIRRLLLSLSGSSVSVTGSFKGQDADVTDYNFMTNETLPEQDNTILSISGIPKRIRELQLDVQGTDLQLHSVNIDWAERRPS